MQVEIQPVSAGWRAPEPPRLPPCHGSCVEGVQNQARNEFASSDRGRLDAVVNLRWLGLCAPWQEIRLSVTDEAGLSWGNVPLHQGWLTDCFDPLRSDCLLSP